MSSRTDTPRPVPKLKALNDNSKKYSIKIISIRICHATIAYLNSNMRFLQLVQSSHMSTIKL